MKKVKVILASILVILTLVLSTRTITHISKVTAPQNAIYAVTDGGGPIYPPPMYIPKL